MTGREESSYRLRVATILSNKADAAFGRGEWREAALVRARGHRKRGESRARRFCQRAAQP